MTESKSKGKYGDLLNKAKAGNLDSQQTSKNSKSDRRCCTNIKKHCNPSWFSG